MFTPWLRSIVLPPTEAGVINGFLTLRSRVPAKLCTSRLRVPCAHRLQDDPIVQAARCSVLSVCHVEKYLGRQLIISSSSRSSSSNEEVEHSNSGKGFGEPAERRAPGKSQQRQQRSLAEVAPAEALIETLGGLSTSEGRVAKGTSMILGTDTSLAKWREMDEKVRPFTCRDQCM